MKLPGIKSFQSSNDAVSVPKGLQQLIVYVLAAAQLLAIVFLLPVYVFNGATFRLDYAAQFIILQILPLVIFAIAYFGMNRYKIFINRAFMAILYSTVAMMIIYGIQSIKYSIPALSGFDENSQQPSGLVTSITTDYVIMATAIILFTLFMYKYRKSNNG